MGFLKSGEDIFKKVEDIDKQQRDYERMLAKLRVNSHDFDMPRT